MLKLPLDEIVGLKIGVCVHSYLCMPDNRDVAHTQKLFVVGGEHPVAIAFAVPVSGFNPPLTLFRVTAFRPLP